MKKITSFIFDGQEYVSPKGEPGVQGQTGPQGPQGDSAVYDPNDPNIPDFVMANTTGQSTTKAMTQKAVTDEIVNADRKTDYGIVESETSILGASNSWYLNKYIKANGSTGSSTAWKACADIYLADYDFVRVSLCNYSSVACIAFFDENGYMEGSSIAGSGVQSEPYYEERIVKIPQGAVRMAISAMKDEETYGTPYCYGRKMTGGIIKANETREILDKERLGEVKVVNAPGWVAGYIGSDGRGHLSGSYCVTLPIKADRIFSLKSTASTPVSLSINYYDKNYTHLGLVQSGKTEITKLDMECEYVRVWFEHDDIDTADSQIEIKMYVGGSGRLTKLTGKSVVTFGDSITWYDSRLYQNGDEDGQRVIGYQSYMRQAGMNVDNKGESGWTMPQIWNGQVQPYTRFAHIDYATIFSGANDSKNGVAVGEVQPIGSTFVITTYTGALQAIIEHILGINDKVKIVLFTPIRGWVYQSGKPPMTKREYVDAVKAVGQLYGLTVIDLYDTIGLNEITRDVMINDPEPPTNTDYSLHPSNYGYERMADVIMPKLADA